MAVTTRSGKGSALTNAEMDANFGSFIRNYESGTLTGSLNVTGDITAYYSSDERLKTKIEVIQDALAKIRQIDGITFNWNEQAKEKSEDIREAGVLAQQVQQVLPEVVTERSDGYLAVHYDKIVSILIQAIKELDDKVKALENK